MDERRRVGMGKSLWRRMRPYGTELVRVLVRVAIYGGCLALFFALLSVNNWPLRHMSRTSATTLLTWCAMGMAMTAVYGDLSLGRRRKRQLIASHTLGFAITDAVTYLQLQIMNVNVNNNQRLILFGEDFLWLVLCMVLQLGLITLAICLGTAAYCRLSGRKRSLMIVNSPAAGEEMCRKMEQAPGLWQAYRTLSYDDAACDAAISDADVVFFAPDVPRDDRARMIKRCFELHKDVLCKADVPDILLSSARQVILEDAPFLEMEASRITLGQRIVKRCMDVMLSTLLLLVTLPLLLIIALLIRTGDGGPVLFTQDRITAGGQRFTIRKFRTMAQDGRVTAIGRFLRRSRMDELPQLLNILKGDMSLVGPRPEMMENVARYKLALPDFAYRERMKAGLTGYAQIEGRHDTSPEDKLMMDLMYIQGYSLYNDVKLLLRTLTVVFKPDSTEGFPDAGLPTET